MPSKSSSRARRRPASPHALPVELIAKILEYLRVYDGPYAPPKDHGIDDLAACALVSRVWHRAANQELYRHLTFQVTASEAEEQGSEDEEDDESDINRVITTNSHLLEAALLQFPHLGAFTRLLTISADEEMEEGSAEAMDAQFAAVQSLDTVLRCSPGLVSVEIESFHSDTSFLLAELAAGRQPKLQELAIRDIMEGSEAEGRFVRLLDSLPCLRKLQVDAPLDGETDASEDDLAA
jgi:hypothetical protein